MFIELNSSYSIYHYIRDALIIMIILIQYTIIVIHSLYLSKVRLKLEILEYISFDYSYELLQLYWYYHFFYSTYFH